MGMIEKTKVIKIGFITGVLLSLMPVFLSVSSSSEVIRLEELVNQFNASTDVQQQEINKRLKGKMVIASGVISNVEERSFLGEDRDENRAIRYYAAITELQKTVKGAIYNVVFCYKNVDEVENICKGQRVEKTGKLLAIIKEGSQGTWMSVWLYMESDPVR